jgi:hypothetical protein
MEQAEIDRYAVSLVGGPAIVAGLNQRRLHGAIGKVPPAAPSVSASGEAGGSAESLS